MDFLITAFPRSGTTWLANLLTTENSVCFHDPLYRVHYNDLETIKSSKAKVNGVSCTGIWRFSDWWNAQDCKKIVVKRKLNEINVELKNCGLPYMDCGTEQLDELSGLHLSFDQLFKFETCNKIHSLCLGYPLSEDRFNILKDMLIQPNFNNVFHDISVTSRLSTELATNQRFL